MLLLVAPLSLFGFGFAFAFGSPLIGE